MNVESLQEKAFNKIKKEDYNLLPDTIVEQIKDKLYFNKFNSIIFFCIFYQLNLSYDIINRMLRKEDIGIIEIYHMDGSKNIMHLFNHFIKNYEKIFNVEQIIKPNIDGGYHNEITFDILNINYTRNFSIKFIKGKVEHSTDYDLKMEKLKQKWLEYNHC